ncbi:MAG: complex I subunit 4 family protein, partial [Chloroflexota bacterium]
MPAYAQIVGLVAILAVPLAAVVVLFLLRGRGLRFAGWIAAASAAVSLTSALAMVPLLYRGQVPTLTLPWIPAVGIEFDLHVDWLTLPFLVTEAAVTLVAVAYSWGYHEIDERIGSFYALLLLFAVGMSGTTLADDMVLFYIFWELMLIASSILILVWGDGERRGAIALKYFIFTHLGSLLVLVGLLILYDATGTDTFSALRAGVALDPGLTRGVIGLFLVGFCVKMAVFPVHLWLPDAHTVAPMPVTIMLAAAMLSMGVYGILRFPLSIFSRADMTFFALPMMIGGVFSEVYGALMALTERDIKRIIAYSSVSQMGYILFGLGTLTADGIMGATLHVVYHAIVKALLFMGAGWVLKSTGRRSITELGGLAGSMPLAAVAMGVGALAIAGMPPFCIFNSEWMIFVGGFHTAHIGLSVVTLLGSLLTVVYAAQLMIGIFFGSRPEGLTAKNVHWAIVVPTLLVTALALIEGVFPAMLFDWVV